jgi:hypothetical protein
LSFLSPWSILALHSVTELLFTHSNNMKSIIATLLFATAISARAILPRQDQGNPEATITDAIQKWSSDAQQIANFIDQVKAEDFSKADDADETTLKDEAQSIVKIVDDISSQKTTADPILGVGSNTCGSPDVLNNDDCFSLDAASGNLGGQDGLSSLKAVLQNIAAGGSQGLPGLYTLISSPNGYCDGILPSFDTYFSLSNKFLSNKFILNGQPDNSLARFTSAPRPAACAAVGNQDEGSDDSE